MYFATVALFVACGEKKSTEPAGTPPGAPTIGVATAGNGSATVTFTAPADTGTAAITHYTASCAATGATTATATEAASPITVTGLANGTTYTCTVTATSADGTSGASGGAQVTPTSGPTVPSPPVIGTATRGNGSASVAFTVPSSNGGSAITGYTASCTAAAVTTTGTNTASPVVVSGLTNGTQYSCNVYATNDVGNSAASSNTTVTPATTPSAPTIGAATPGNGSASIAFTASTSSGGATITVYTATCSANSQTTRAGTSATSPITVSSLVSGVQYSCSVVATNSVGNSVASATVNVTPNGPPGPPTIDSVTSGNTLATVAFTAPTSDGGSAITGYVATCTNAGIAKTGNGASSPIVVSTLTNGVVYLCNVKATNAHGTGAASADIAVTPLAAPTVPGVPTMGTATAGVASISVSFTAPISNGGSAITGYTVSCTGGGVTITGSGAASPITVTGLTNGTTYFCNVAATNAVGTGPASGSAGAIPRPLPDAPTNLVATAGNASASFTFTVPANSGVAAISSYTVSCTDGSPAVPKTGSASASPVTVSSLTNGTLYTCSVTAANAVGTGPASAPVTVTPVAPPSTAGFMCTYSHNFTNTFLNLTASVSYSCTSTVRTGTGNQVPDHTPGTFPNSGNPHAILAQTAVPFKTTLTPSAAASVTNISQGPIGYAKNSAKFDPSTAEVCPGKSYCPAGMSGTWNVEALGQTLFSAGVDNSNAHVQPNGAYHYHGMPTGYMDYLGSNNGTTMIFVGFALDGFPIYAKWGYTDSLNTSSAIKEMVSSYRKKATLPAGRIDTLTVAYGTFTQDWEYIAGLGDLDQCNGRFGKTPDFPNGIYHYYITNTYPYIQRCYKGTATP